MRKWLILLSALSGDHSEQRARVDVGRRQRHSALLGSPGGGRAAGRARRRAGFRRAGTGAARRRPRQRRADRRHARIYRAIDIVSPAEQETLWNIGTQLNVQVRIQPQLQPGHRYRLGARRSAPQSQRDEPASSPCPNVFRGSHTLQRRRDRRGGAELMRSAEQNVLRAADQHAESRTRRSRRPPAGGN